MKPEEFQRLYQCNFNPSDGILPLVERLERYYKDTPDSMQTHIAMEYWREFKRWAEKHGYTSEQINRAKAMAEEPHND